MNLSSMWEVAQTFLNSYIFLIMIAIPVFMVANMVGGAIIAESFQEFDVKILKASIYKYLALLVMALLIYIGGALAEPALNEIIQANLQIVTLLQLGLATVCGKYAFQAVAKFIQVTGIKINKEEE